MKTLLLIALLMLGGCSAFGGTSYIDVSAGTDILDSTWEGSGAVVEVAVGTVYDNGVYIEYSHTSNLRSGPPFNDDFENNIDRISIGKRFIIKDGSK